MHRGAGLGYEGGGAKGGVKGFAPSFDSFHACGNLIENHNELLKSVHYQQSFGRLSKRPFCLEYVSEDVDAITKLCSNHACY